MDTFKKTFYLLLLILLPVSHGFTQEETDVEDKADDTPAVVWLAGWRGSTYGILKDLPSAYGPVETRLKSAEEAAKAFNEEVFADLIKKVDFTKQDIEIVQFSGSGQNKLDCFVSLSNPPKYVYLVEYGQTKDLVNQIQVFAVRKDAIAQPVPFNRVVPPRKFVK